jgi:lysine-N-methylase
MNTFVPSYYGDFKCTGGSCSDNCCRGGWLIELDGETLEYIDSLEGEWGARLRSSLMEDEDGDTCFRLVDGNCPHLGDDGLCMVYTALGEEHMGLVCREFPRFTNDCGTYAEKGLGLACEEAARIILYDDRRFGLVGIGESQCPDGVKCDGNVGTGELMAFRQALVNVIESGEGDIDTRIALCLQMAEDYQDKINCSGKMEGFTCHANTVKPGIEIMNPALGRTLFDIYDSLEVLNESWTAMRDAAFTYLFEDAQDSLYRERMAASFAAIEHGERLAANIFIYLLYRYVPKALEDYDVLDKVRFGVSFYVVLRQMLAGLYGKCGHPLGEKQVINLVKDFSRQVEYSEDNVEAVCEEFLFGIA